MGPLYTVRQDVQQALMLQPRLRQSCTALPLKEPGAPVRAALQHCLRALLAQTNASPDPPPGPPEMLKVLKMTSLQTFSRDLLDLVEVLDVVDVLDELVLLDVLYVLDLLDLLEIVKPGQLPSGL